jgi:uncharacterized DUF497 family protein
MLPMHIEEIFISEAVENKLFSKHGVTPDEVEDLVWYSGYKVLIRRTREGRYEAFGRTISGRYLTVVFARKDRAAIRIVTARDMNKAERRRYRGG